MAKKRISDLATEITAPADDDILHAIDASDSKDKRIQLGTIKDWIGGGGGSSRSVVLNFDEYETLEDAVYDPESGLGILAETSLSNWELLPTEGENEFLTKFNKFIRWTQDPANGSTTHTGQFTNFIARFTLDLRNPQMQTLNLQPGDVVTIKICFYYSTIANYAGGDAGVNTTDDWSYDQASDWRGEVARAYWGSYGGWFQPPLPFVQSAQYVSSMIWRSYATILSVDEVLVQSDWDEGLFRYALQFPRLWRENQATVDISWIQLTVNG